MCRKMANFHDGISLPVTYQDPRSILWNQMCLLTCDLYLCELIRIGLLTNKPKKKKKAHTKHGKRRCHTTFMASESLSVGSLDALRQCTFGFELSHALRLSHSDIGSPCGMTARLIATRHKRRGNTSTFFQMDEIGPIWRRLGVYFFKQDRVFSATTRRNKTMTCVEGQRREGLAFKSQKKKKKWFTMCPEIQQNKTCHS